MAKLSEQIGSTRLTRTERVRQKQERNQEARRLQNEKNEAKRIQEQKFSNVKSLEEYSQEYYSLDPAMQKYFKSPAEMQDLQDQEIQTTKERLQARGKEVKDELNILISKSSLNDGNQDDREERMKYLEGYLQKLGEGIGELEKGKNISYSQIDQYAQEYGEYKEAQKRAGNEGRSYQKQQLQKIEDLEAQGYKPFIVEESSGGKSTKTFLEFFNASTGTFKRIATFSPAKTVSLTGFQKTDYGSLNLPRTLSYAGKDYAFSSNVSVYKDQSGELATKYGSLGVTEQELQDQAYKEYLKERSTKPSFDDEVREKELSKTNVDKILGFYKDLYFTKPKQAVKSAGEFLKDLSPKIINKLGLQNVSKSYQEGLNRSYNYYQDNKGGFFSKGVPVGIISGAGGSVNLKEIKDKSLEALNVKIDDLTNERYAQLGVEDVEKKYQEEYQLRFEDQYVKDIIYGETTFDEASEEFKESETATLLSSNYEKELTQLSRDAKISGTGWKIFGLSSAEKLIKVTPATYGGYAVGGLAVTGLPLLKTIPPSVSYTATGLFGAYGTYKAFSPTSTEQERIGGIVTAGVSAGVLTYGAVRYLRSPVVKQQVLKPKVKSYKAEKVYGFEGSKDLIVNKHGQVLQQNVYFPDQKLSRQVIYGRRTIVTTKGRILSTKFWNKLGVKQSIIDNALYKGIPTQQLGKTYVVQGLRGSTVISTPSGYQKALKRLTQYGYSQSQAIATLRYTAPRVIDTSLSQGVITSLQQGDKVTVLGRMDVVTSQPKIKLQDGITTRGAKSYTDVYEFQRSFADPSKKIIRTDIYKQGKTYEEFLELSKVKAGAVTTGNRVTMIDHNNKQILINTEKKIQELKGFAVRRRVYPTKSRAYDVNQAVTDIVKSNRKKLMLYDTDDLFNQGGISYTVDPNVVKPSEASGFALKPAKIKKTPFDKTFSDPVKDVIKQTSTPSGSDVQRVVNRIETQSGSQATFTRSQYYGTGQYERTIDQGFFTLPNVNVKSPLSPIVRDAMVIKSSTNLVSNLGLGASASTLRSNVKLKDQLRSNFTLKDAINFDQSAKLKQDPRLKLNQGLALRSALQPAQTLRTNLVTDLVIPRTPTYRTPSPSATPKPFVMPSFNLAKQIRARSKKKEKIDLKLYLPDFTSRALGLKPETLTQEQAQARLNKILTGLETRRGVIIR